MNNLLNQFLKRKGLKYDELSPEELRTYFEWTEVLAGRPLTDEQIQAELAIQYEKMLSGYFDTEKYLDPNVRQEMRAAIRQTRKLLAVLARPKVEKKIMEEYLSE